MFIFVRAITYAVLFIGLVLIYVPARLLAWTGIVRPETIGFLQIAGMVIGVLGLMIALWCVYTFATIGRGTPAPFDPPRRLVTRGPYQFVRNPMYIGAGLALIGATLFYESLSLLSYVGVLFVIVHSFIIWYEEPTLRRTFGNDYEEYCSRVKRWLPGKRMKGNHHA
jgi:protein-S-isoprenylcysteine O-methyltransferase Ste14